MADVVMPALGESVSEATITRWLIAEGDIIEVGQAIVEVATDKVDMEVQSTLAGRVNALLVEEEETVPVGTLIASLEEGSASRSITTSPPVRNVDEPRQEVVEVSANLPMRRATDSSMRAAQTTQRPYRTFLVRRLAQQADIDLSELLGSGAGGRVTKSDVVAASRNPAQDGRATAAHGWMLMEAAVTIRPEDVHHAVGACIREMGGVNVTVVDDSGENLVASIRPTWRHSAVLSVGTVKAAPVVLGEGIAIAMRVYLGLSYGALWEGDAGQILHQVAKSLAYAPTDRRG